VGRKHPLNEERSKRRDKLRSRTKPDYCYSDAKLAEVEMPECEGPWQNEPDYNWSSSDPRDDNKLSPMETVELYCSNVCY